MTGKERKRKYEKLLACETTNTKACSKCLKIRPIEEFSLNSNGRRSLQVWCKFCVREYKRKDKDARTVKWLELRDQENKNEKVCKECLVIKPLSEFYNQKDNTRTRKNVSGTCKQCINAKYNPQTARQKCLKYRYNITEEDYKNLFEKQNGKCAICGSKDIGKRDANHLAVDHCHETGKIRGLLCAHCNKALGGMKDDPDLLKKAADYLEIYNEETSYINSGKTEIKVVASTIRFMAN